VLIFPGYQRSNALISGSPAGANQNFNRAPT
jgi:hypothetical protein